VLGYAEVWTDTVKFLEQATYQNVQSEVLLQMPILGNHVFINQSVCMNTATSHTQFLPATLFDQICASITVFPSRVLYICMSYSWFESHSIAVETKDPASLKPEPTTSAHSIDISLNFPRSHLCSSRSISVLHTFVHRGLYPCYKLGLPSGRYPGTFISKIRSVRTVSPVLGTSRKLYSSTALYDLYKPESFLLRSNLT
jgi:hypothetical protein